MSDLTMDRYDRDSVRVVREGKVVGMLLRHCDYLWSINDTRERRLVGRRFRTAKRAFDYAVEQGIEWTEEGKGE